MRRWLVLAAVALPVLGTMGSIASNEAALRGASEWRIPITGYDPRDPLRGHYFAFRYSWAARGDPALCARDGCRLCLEDAGRRVSVVPKTASCAGMVDPAASGFTVLRGFDGETGRVSAAARLWIPETSGPVLERQLRTRPMVAVARLTRGGRLLAERVEPAR